MYIVAACLVLDLVFISILTETPSEVPTEYLSAWAVAGITLAALSTLIVMALIQSAANLYLHRYVQPALIVCHQYQWYEQEFIINSWYKVYYIKLVTKPVVQGERRRKSNHCLRLFSKW